MKRMTKITKLALLLLLIAPGLISVGEDISAISVTSASIATKSPPPTTRGFLPKDGRLLFPIGCYELPKEDAELEKMAQSGINIVRCRIKLTWIVLPQSEY